jgi:hypothetical protein
MSEVTGVGLKSNSKFALLAQNLACAAILQSARQVGVAP